MKMNEKNFQPTLDIKTDQQTLHVSQLFTMLVAFI